jgi:hypothetical protein
MKKIILSATAAVALLACSSPVKETNVSPTLPEWLEGSWVSEADSIRFIESWQKTNDSLLSGRGYAIKGTDTLFSEKLEMRRENDTLYYIPTVSDQNKGEAIRFRLSKIDSTGFVAENSLHDFPKKIEYTIKGDSIYAILTGSENGKERKEIFPMKKQ